METMGQTLRDISLFTDLSDDTLAHLAHVVVRRVCAPGEIVIVERLQCRAAYFIAEGDVRVLRTSHDGREQVLVRLGAGESFNTAAAFQRQAGNHATVQAISETVVYAISCDDFHALVSEHPDLALAVLQDFAERLGHLVDLVETLSLYTVRGRLARFLLDHAEAGEVEKRWTQAEMAARLGTVRDMIGRSIRAFADAGLLRVDRQRIMLLDREGLEEETKH